MYYFVPFQGFDRNDQAARPVGSNLPRLGWSLSGADCPVGTGILDAVGVAKGRRSATGSGQAPIAGRDQSCWGGVPRGNFEAR